MTVDNGDKNRPSTPPQTVTNYVAIPPDGGWGWVIVAASMLCNIVVDGIVFSFGVFLSYVAEDYGVSTSQASIANSLLSGFYLISGPFVSAITNRYGFRLTGILGSLVASFSFVVASMSSSIEVLYIVYGIIGGIGFGMIYVPAVVTTGFYFERLRALAMGISVTGSGIGTIIVGPISSLLIDHFGWRGALLIQAGIILHCAVFSSLYRPLKRIHIPVEAQDLPGDEVDGDKTEIPLLQRIKIARDQLKKADSSLSLNGEIGITALQPSETNRFLGANNNICYPLAIEALQSSTHDIRRSLDSLELKENYSNSHKRKYEKNITLPKHSGGNEKQLNSYKTKKKSMDDDYDPLKELQTDDALLTEHIHDDVFYVPKKKHSSERRDSITLKYRKRTDSDGSHKSVKSRRGTWTKNQAESGVRPLYRDDIFLQASLNRLPQYKSYGSGLDYTMSVTRLPTTKDVEEEEEGACQLCPEAVRRTLATMLDLTLLRSPSFMLFAIAGFITMMGVFTPFMYIAERGRLNNMDPSMLIFLVPCIGITNTIGRIMCGSLSMLPQVNSLMLNNLALTIGGIGTIFSGYSYSPYFQCFYAALFGLAVSFWASLRSIAAVDLIGLEKLTNAFGILILFQGLAAVIGAPIAGMFMEYTGSYDASFYLSGGLLLFSGIICYPLNYIKKWEERKQQKIEEV